MEAVGMKCHRCGTVVPGKIDGQPKPLPPVPSSFDRLASTLRGDIFLRVLCEDCSGEGYPQLLRLHLSWVDAVHLILYHMIMSRECDNCIEGLKFFHWRHICEEMLAHWSHLWSREISGNWQTSVVAALSTYAGKRFRGGKEIRPSLTGFWTLIDEVSPADLEPPESVRPAECVFVRRGEGDEEEVTLVPWRTSADMDPELPIAASTEGEHEREAKRLRRQMRKLAASYVFSNLDFDRPNPPGPLAISQLPTHTAPQVKISGDDGWTVSNALGYCMARTTHGIDRPGSWYFEVTIHSGPVRLGVAQILAQTQGPVGFDEYAYGIRSRDGAIYHCGRNRPYANRSFDSGSVVGVKLIIPPDEEERVADCRQLEQDWPPLRLGQYQVRQEVSRTGTVSFSIDGHEYGVAFTNTYIGKYYPAVSMFGGASVTLNMGPIFRFVPMETIIPACRIAESE